MKNKLAFFLLSLSLLGFTNSYGQFSTNSEKHASLINKNNLKTTFLSWYTGSIKLTYERYLYNNQSVEITAGYIGAGFHIKETQPKGALARLAYKFMFPYPLSNQNYLNGFYLKPELAFSSYEFNLSPHERNKVNRLGIMGNIGYQIIFRDLVIDIFGGVGFGIGNTNGSNYHHGFMGFRPGDIFAFTAGAKLGWAF